MTVDQPHHRRLPRAERRTQLLTTARELIDDVGTDGFTLDRLAARAGVTKPVIYDHFGNRAGVLTEIFRECKDAQREALTAALSDTPPELPVVAAVVSEAYINCCLTEGTELRDVSAALTGSATLRQVRKNAEDVYLAQCRQALEPFCGPVTDRDMAAFTGAGDALARCVLDNGTTAADACRTLTRILMAVTDDRDRHN